MTFDFKGLTAKTRGLLKTAGAQAKKTAGELKEKADRAAEAVAARCTELTGRETTADEVKKAALIAAGVAVLGTVIVDGLSATDGVAALADGGASAAGSDLSFGNQFEDITCQAFAEGGHSLNFYTPHVDSCGTIYSGPNG
jgi:hypothetical protein